MNLKTWFSIFLWGKPKENTNKENNKTKAQCEIKSVAFPKTTDPQSQKQVRLLNTGCPFAPYLPVLEDVPELPSVSPLSDI